jgi:hypothetical protein
VTVGRTLDGTAVLATARPRHSWLADPHAAPIGAAALPAMPRSTASTT